MSWKGKAVNSDIYYIKGVTEAVMRLLGISEFAWEPLNGSKLSNSVVLREGNKVIAEAGTVSKNELNRFDIRQDVYFADISWNAVLEKALKETISFRSLPNQLPVYRDLAMVVSGTLPFGEVESAIEKVGLDKLRSVQLFDVFESEKIGAGKKSMAVNFTFLDDEKTLTDKEIDSMMNRIMRTLEQDLNAEIRKGA
jgi:phenylalanyl-tRNA synthetase beta chain